MRRSDLPYFFFGTLMDDEVLAVVLGREPRGLRTEPASLSGFRRLTVKGESYPTLRPDPEAGFRGLLVWDLSAHEVARVAFYEGEEYRLRDLSVTRADGTAQRALAFAADQGLATEGEWEPTRWRDTERPWLLAAARAFMAHFGTLEDASFADRRWRAARTLARRGLSR
jgi:hypothetical protein